MRLFSHSASKLKVQFQGSGAITGNFRLFVTFLFTLCLWAANNTQLSAQYVHTSGRKIIDKNGDEIIFRGMGLGGWMLQEGYMLETSGFAGTQYKIKALIQDLIGKDNTNAFYDAWLTNHCTRRDIDSLASWGFNSVRLPMHYNLYTLPIESESIAGQQTWLEKGFALTDSLIKWCAANNMYVILDLHGAPGGQGNDYNISDRDPTKPSLWDSPANQQKTIALWKKLAERYKNEPWIGGYDLINETNWNFTPNVNINGCDETTNAPLRQLYEKIIAAIRTVDTNHMIFIEGNCWGNNHRGLLNPKLDNNMTISFHKYWNNNDQATLTDLISIRDTYNVPLWLGESGENSNNWFTSAIALMERNNIGWAWWPLKKVNSIVNPLTVVKNPGYEQLLQYWKGLAAKPSANTAYAALMQLAENLKIQNCIYRKDVIDAMFRQVSTSETLPFSNNLVPGVIHASDFDLGRNYKAYVDSDSGTYHVSIGGDFKNWNLGYNYRNDGVDIERNNDSDINANGYNIGWTFNGEWLTYTLLVDSTAAYDVSVRYTAPNNNTVIKLNVNDADQSSPTTLEAAGTWSNKVISNVILYKGTQKLKFIFEKGGANFGFLNLVLNKKINEVAFKATSAETLRTNPIIHLSLNKKIDLATIAGIDNFSCTVNDTPATVTSLQADPQNPTKLIITIDATIFDNDKINLTYTTGQLKSLDETTLESFTLLVKNNLPVHQTIPGKIEAEDFIFNQGIVLEGTTDSGAGQNIGHTDAGDYLDFRIRVTSTGTYTLEARVASMSAGGEIEIQQHTESNEVLNTATVLIQPTGGWQTWRTVSVKMTLTEGRGILRARVVRSGFNLNWFKFTGGVVSSIDKENKGLIIYPNPVENNLFINTPGHLYKYNNFLSIRNTSGSVVWHNKQVSAESLQNLYVGDLPKGMYILEFGMGNKIWQNKFIIR